MSVPVARRLWQLLFRVRESSLLRRANLRGDPRHCGLVDMVHSHWLQAGTGELFPGFDVGPQDSVLDVGCGDGLAASFCAKRGARVVFCDLDAAKVGAIRAALAPHGGAAQGGLVASAAAIPLGDASVSRIIATEVLEHVDDPAAVLAELVRVGKPGAKYLISVPDADGERMQRPFAHPSYFSAPNHVRIVEPAQLERWIEAAGLRIEGRGQWGFYWLMAMCFFWATNAETATATPTMDRIAPPYHPLIESWAETWTRLLELPGAAPIIAALNERMPKTRVVIARRA